MGPKSKKWTKASAKPKAANNPTTENDFLELADEYEQAANKWKAGDTAKSLRFFQRAIDTYNDALKQWPTSFDLAYNKAVLQYEMTQDPRLTSALGDPIALLNETLQSHRYALNLNQENADILFNTAQVLVSAAELFDQPDNSDDESSMAQAIALLKEAVELFDLSLARQEYEYTESQQQAELANDELANANDQPEQTSEMESSSISENSGEWATVVEPVTPSTLLETVLAQLSALTLLITLSTQVDDGRQEYRAFADVGSPIIHQKLPGYISLLPETDPNAEVDKPRGAFLSLSTATLQSEQAAPTNPRLAAQEEANLAIALFTSAVAEAEFKDRLLDSEGYYARLTGAFEPLLPATGLLPGPVVKAYAEALDAFISRIFEAPYSDDPNIPWMALSRAADMLSRFLKQPTAPGSGHVTDRPSLYILLGDVELLRYRIASSPEMEGNPAAKGRDVLMKNAGVYYRGAAKIAVAEGRAGGDEEREARAKAVVVAALLGEKVDRQQLDEEVLKDMIAGGMVGEEDLGLFGMQ